MSGKDVFHDDGHPNFLGSWAAATTIYATIFSDMSLPDEKQDVCVVQWQGAGLSANRLASEQALTERECFSLSAEELAFSAKAANQSMQQTP